jgi:hypothetical protein
MIQQKLVPLDASSAFIDMIELTVASLTQTLLQVLIPMQFHQERRSEALDGPGSDSGENESDTKDRVGGWSGEKDVCYKLE